MIGKRKRGKIGSKNLAIKTRNVEEITFDSNDRHAFLTGFRKRRLQRVKHAQEEAAKQEREEKLQQRKELREERKREAEEHLEAVQKALKKADGLPTDEESSDDDELEEWTGFNDRGQPLATKREDQYSNSEEDEDATVTVEEVNVVRDGFRKDERKFIEQTSEHASSNRTGWLNGEESAAFTKGKHTWAKGKLGTEKKKRKKFRYESTAERKENRAQQRAVKARKKARREGK